MRLYIKFVVLNLIIKFKGRICDWMYKVFIEVKYCAPNKFLTALFWSRLYELFVKQFNYVLKTYVVKI